jgi:hypothetical protein
LWTTLLVLALVAVAGAAYWLVANWLASREATPAPTITVTITAPPPTPTISPSPRESGTDFYNAIPSTIGAYVLVATEPGPDFEAAGAYDSYILTYSDGAHTVTVLAGQWRSEAAATDAFNAMGGPEGWPGADVDLTSTVCPDPPTPDTAALWRNVTAIFEVRAPDGGATEFFCRMPM